MGIGAKFLIVMAASSMVGAQPAAPAIAVSGQTLTVRIQQQTELQTVLQTLCTRLRASCNGLDSATGVTIGAMNVSGTWSEVISKLMEGSDLDYSSVAPSSSAPPALVVLKRPAGAATSVTASSAPPAQSPAIAESYVPSAQESQVSAASSTSSESSEPAGSSGPVAAAAPSSFYSFGGSQSGNLLDSSGQPVPVSSEGPAYDPFATVNGRPVMLPPPSSGDSAEPFSDASGRPIPVPHSSGPAYEPFPDANGNPIPVPSPH